MAPVKGKPMILYTAAMDTSLGALLAQHNDQGRENSLYYLSRTLVGAELRGENGRADALASLVASLGLSESKEMTITVGARRILQPYKKVAVDVQVEEVLTMSKRLDGQDDPLDWRLPFMEYLQGRRLPDDRAKQAEVRRRSVQFVMWKDTLYKRSLDGMLLRCIVKDKVEEVMREVHSGACGAHQSGPKLQMQIKRLGYYWPTMIADCIGFAKRCQACQFHGDFSHSPPEPLHFTVCSWPFAAWGMDVIGPFTPPSSKGHRYILAATDYFSKWAEAIALRDVKRDTVADFIRTHIIYRFGVPESVIADNAKYFKEGALYKLYANYNIKYNHSSKYHASENGLAEAFNKTLCKILKKMVDKIKRSWNERLF
ncbi:hypothetical protein RJ639_025679 [Escallonia herrerae]|uniref:Integrase catalytic domain-containing protein n=1 Tax=Escallonia herrerae TaxID=1293975 RepID=A0AA88UXF2_9ASTE|nr:hypothetical protein RJ639_025679 [Escallonia herrerae]